MQGLLAHVLGELSDHGGVATRRTRRRPRRAERVSRSTVSGTGPNGPSHAGAGLVPGEPGPRELPPAGQRGPGGVVARRIRRLADPRRQRAARHHPARRQHARARTGSRPACGGRAGHRRRRARGDDARPANRRPRQDNARITGTCPETDEQYEGCLSFFDVRGMGPRPLTLEVEHTTLDGRQKITAFPYGFTGPGRPRDRPPSRPPVHQSHARWRQAHARRGVLRHRAAPAQGPLRSGVPIGRILADAVVRATRLSLRSPQTAKDLIRSQVFGLTPAFVGRLMRGEVGAAGQL
ncbi:hypothetical protein B0I32_11928 [Nonomuraea fuscirosea]|uniref:Uncharacterized protein n=1 Tax=Nonomuraea fuscirosea TaxID=1291556 RepID=A0A2T0MNM6_9ACTN|nr:hypothetical protein B0I32_11928 [Nonomuraea fuscirosea]